MKPPLLRHQSPWGTGRSQDRLSEGNTSLSQCGGAIAAGAESEWFIRTVRMRRTDQGSSSVTGAPESVRLFSMNSPEHIFQILLTVHRTSGSYHKGIFIKQCIEWLI